ncbi:unnamed protein product [Adineta ricciae]|uniref:BZIP domain-containing protein n=1 Tax=Adineta ricciae TaxID=249248 RepID=A0A813UWX9_ADIRI|nr:unnamed protein product [Adineta ricciae]
MISSIASRLEILADIADQVEHNGENTQQLFFKYLLQSIQKKQNKPVEIATKLTDQSPSSIQNEFNQISQLRASHSSSNIDLCKQSKPNISQTDVYFDRRKKNNEAAKRSRDARRVKEDQIAVRAAWLEQENLQLRLENAHLKQENLRLRSQIHHTTDS